MKILGFLHDTSWNDMDAVQYYRCYLPLREVNKSAEDIATEIIGKGQVGGLTDDDLGGRDIYMMARMYHEDCETFLDEIHRRGGVFVLDSDDDLTETYRLVSGRGLPFIKVLSMVDYVTCSTEVLADLFAQYAKRPPIILKNHIDTDWMIGVASKAKRLVEGLTIGFSGSPTHWGDWYLPAVPFARIVREFSDKGVVPILHGETPRYLDHAANGIMKFGGVPFAIYPVILRQFDVVLCAVDIEDEFSSCKSNVKALECMAVGAVPICSRFGPYMELYEAGAPIVVIEEESRDGWYEAMRDLLQDEDRRLTLRDAGASWVRANRDMCVSGYKHWADFYRSIAT